MIGIAIFTVLLSGKVTYFEDIRTSSPFKPTEYKLPTIITKTSPFPILGIFFTVFNRFSIEDTVSGA